MENKKGIVLGMTIAAIVLIAAVGGVSAQLPACPAPGDTTITASCELDQNWNVPAGQAGYIIGADDIVIDGNGHKITGSTTNADCEWAGESAPCTVSGIYNAGYDNVVIKNLEIEGFCTGVALKGTGPDKVRNDTVENCSIHDNGFNTMSGGSEMATHGIHACWIDEGEGSVPALTIKGNDIYNNEGTGGGCGDGGNGIFIYAGSPDAKHEKAVISCNKLHDNAKAGFWTKMMLSQCNITYNEIWGNGNGAGIGDDVRGGIILRCKKSNENLIAYNYVHDHAAGGYGYGIYVGGGSNIIKCNTVTDNSKHGISMARSDGSFNNELYHNAVCGNGQVDVSAFGLSSNTVGDNNSGVTASNYCDSSVCPGPPYFVYDCNNLVSVYYDFDRDDHYSDEPENCNCGQGACCNPGLFNESGVPSHCDYCDCHDTPGDDPNDCDSTIPGDIGTPITSCNFNANVEGEYYYLPDDLNCAAGEAGVIIGAANVIIDGKDYKITGTTTDADCAYCTATEPCTVSGIYNAAGFDNVVIMNLEIEGFCTGIALKGTGPDKVRNNTIDNCEIHDNGFSTGEETGTHGIHACLIDGTVDEPALTITNNDIYNNEGTGSACGSGGNGIFIVAGGPATKDEYCDISYNNLYDNAKAGFWTKMQLSKSTIANNEVWGNGAGTGVSDDVRGGIILRCKKSDNNLIAYNNASGNVGDGVGYGMYVGGNGNSIINNTVNENTAVGISMGRSDGSSNNELRNNTVCWNDLGGIGIAGSNNELRNNNVSWNGFDGIGIGGGTGNTLYDNIVCDNGQVSGVDINDGDATIGDNNTCQTGINYNDASAIPPNVCVYQCHPTEEPDLVIEDIKAVRWCCCGIALREDGIEKMQVMFIDDPELAKELGDEELRKEVAEALAKDPELAEEIAVKLAGDDEKAAEKLSDPKLIAEHCCRCNAIKELADLLDTELTAEQQHEMSDQLDMIVGCGCCCGCCCNCLTADCKCCCCGRFIAYKIANVGDGDAGWSLSNLTVNGRVRSVDIVRPLDAGQSRWEVFPCYRMWWWSSWPREVTVCADVTDWVAESDETNNCRTEWFPPYVTPEPTLRPIRALK